MPIHRLMRAGVHLSLDDYMKLTAKSRIYVTLWVEAEESRKPKL